MIKMPNKQDHYRMKYKGQMKHKYDRLNDKVGGRGIFIEVLIF